LQSDGGERGIGKRYHRGHKVLTAHAENKALRQAHNVRNRQQRKGRPTNPPVGHGKKDPRRTELPRKTGKPENQEEGLERKVDGRRVPGGITKKGEVPRRLRMVRQRKKKATRNCQEKWKRKAQA